MFHVNMLTFQIQIKVELVGDDALLSSFNLSVDDLSLVSMLPFVY